MCPNSSLYFLSVQPKIMSATYIWHTNNSPPYVFVKSVGSREPGLKLLLFRKSLSVSYQARGACLRPYSALLSFYTISGCFGSSKPGGCCRCQNRRISGRGSRTVRLRLMVTGDGGHNVYPGLGPLYGGNTLLPAWLILMNMSIIRVDLPRDHMLWSKP